MPTRFGTYKLAVFSFAAAAACAGTQGEPGGASSKDCRPPQAASSSSDGLAIRNGQLVVEQDPYPFVGMLFYDGVEVLPGPLGLPQLGRDTRNCSAVLVCSNVVLTAAHCFTDAAKPENYSLYRGLKPGDSPSLAASPNVATIIPQILGGSSKEALRNELGPDAALGRAARGKRIEILNLRGVKGSMDLALLQLDRNLTGKTAVLASEMLDDQGDEGPRATIVGYGAVGPDKNGKERGGGSKKFGAMRFSGYMATPENQGLDGLGKLYATGGMGADVSQSDNACPGDSGGATIINGKVYGIISRIMNFRDGKIQPNPTCGASNITLFTPIPKQLTWLNNGMRAMCSSSVDVQDMASAGDAATASSSSAADASGSSPGGEGGDAAGDCSR